MILLLAGTSEGRELAAALQEKGFPLVVTTVTDYGARLASGGGRGGAGGFSARKGEIGGFLAGTGEAGGFPAGTGEVLAGALTAGDLAGLMEKKGIRAVIDATHPFARTITLETVKVCRDRKVPYLRFERQTTGLPEHPLIYRVRSYSEAARTAAGLGDTIFLTTGTRNLEEFLVCRELQGKRVVARILPEEEGIRKCRALGLLPRDIIAIQGPFPEELNKAMFAAFGAQVIVTKESGPRGGTDTKIAAALSLGLPVVVIERPALDYPLIAYSLEEVIDFLKGVD